MGDISTFSPIANNNNLAVPDGAPEGWKAPEVNNWGREVMAAVRRQWEIKEFFDFGDTPIFFSTTRFDVNTDLTARYQVGRRLKFFDATTLFGTIVTSTFTGPNTEVTVVLDSGVLSVALTAVALGSDALNPAISGSAIADGTIDTAQLADDAVTVLKLATDAVTNVKVADKAIDFTNLVDVSKLINIGTTSGPTDVYELETGFNITTPQRGMKISATAHASNTGAAVAQLQFFANTGDTPTFVSATQFNVTGVDVTANYVVNDRIKITDASTLFGTIFSSTFTGGNTEVVVTLDSGSITVAISAVATGAAIAGENIKKKGDINIQPNDIKANDLFLLEFDGIEWWLISNLTISPKIAYQIHDADFIFDVGSASSFISVPGTQFVWLDSRYTNYTNPICIFNMNRQVLAAAVNIRVRNLTTSTTLGTFAVPSSGERFESFSFTAPTADALLEIQVQQTSNNADSNLHSAQFEFDQ